MSDLELIRVDQEVYDDPKHYRLVCFIKGAGKLAIWGRDGNTGNVDQVRAWIISAGFPIRLRAEWRPPAPWSAKYGHTHWLEEGQEVQLAP